MRRRILVILAIIATLLIGLALVLCITEPNADNNTSEAVSNIEKATSEVGIIDVEYLGTDVCEIIVDFGNVPRSSTTTKKIRITNKSNNVLVLTDYSTQCRCMWLNFDREPIAVEDSIDITLSFDSRGEWGSVGNYMEITTSQDKSIVVWIGAEIL